MADAKTPLDRRCLRRSTPQALSLLLRGVNHSLQPHGHPTAGAVIVRAHSRTAHTVTASFGHTWPDHFPHPHAGSGARGVDVTDSTARGDHVPSTLKEWHAAVGAILIPARVNQLGHEPPSRPGLLDLRCRRLARMYRDLARSGWELEDVRAFSADHAMALLKAWRERQRAVTTIRSDWSILRGWCTLIGKPGLIGTLREAWPDAPPAPPSKAGAAARHKDDTLLLALAKQKDRTHYFVERLCQLARLSVQEALQVTPKATHAASTAPSSAAKLTAAMESRGEEVRILLGEIATFLEQLDRPTLAWSGLTLGQATRRHENRLAYVRRTMASDEEFLEART